MVLYGMLIFDVLLVIIKEDTLFEIEFYETASGRSEVFEMIEKLERERVKMTVFDLGKLLSI